MIANTAASILVQQLVEQGVVERSENSKDRHRTFVRLTAGGAGLIAGLRENIKTNLLRWLGQLSDEDLTRLRGGLGALMCVMQSEKEQEMQEG